MESEAYEYRSHCRLDHRQRRWAALPRAANTLAAPAELGLAASYLAAQTWPAAPADSHFINLRGEHPRPTPRCRQPDSRCRRDREDGRYEVQGKSADDADLHRPRPVVFGRRGADAQSGPDAGGGEPTIAPQRRAAADGPDERALFALGIGKSIVIDLPRDIKDVLVADPKIANAVVRSAQRAYIIGAAVGQTNIVFFDPARPADRGL